MRINSLIIALAVSALSATRVSAIDLADYLPIYNLSYTQLVPGGARQIIDDNRERDDYRAQYDYDEKGRLTAIYHSGWNAGWGSIEKFKWNKNGRLLSSTTEEHGSDVSFYHQSTTYTADSQGRVAGYKKVYSFSAPPEINHVKLNTVECSYTYDDMGNCVKVTIVNDGKEYDYEEHAVVQRTPTTTEILYRYTPKGQLIEAVEMVDAKENSRQTFEYALGRDENVHLSKSVYKGPCGYDEGMCTIITDYTCLGEDVPSYYLKKITYKNEDEPGICDEYMQLRIFNGLPISQTEGR